MKIIIPQRYVPISNSDFLIFLAGPVLGGGDWQRYVIEHFMSASIMVWSEQFRSRVLERIRFVVPCRWEDGHSLSSFFSKQPLLYDSPVRMLSFGQTGWEVHYMSHVMLNNGGLIAFGLFPENKESPRTDGLPYAGDTRGEIGRWTTMASDTQSENVIVGYHKDFLGCKVIIKNLDIFWNPSWILKYIKVIQTPEEMADWIALEVNHRMRKILFTW